MTFYFPVGWWLLPLAATVGAFIWQWWVHKDERRSGDYGDIGMAMGQLVTLAVAVIVSLAAWLIWALLR